jgi:predicted ATPase with chaperone activity
VPLHNAPEAALAEGVDVYGATSLAEVVEFLGGHKSLEPIRSGTERHSVGGADQELDFGEVKGQRQGKRAVEVVAGGHNILMLGPISPREPISFQQGTTAAVRGVEPACWTVDSTNNTLGPLHV